MQLSTYPKPARPHPTATRPVMPTDFDPPTSVPPRDTLATSPLLIASSDEQFVHPVRAAAQAAGIAVQACDSADRLAGALVARQVDCVLAAGSAGYLQEVLQAVAQAERPDVAVYVAASDDRPPIQIPAGLLVPVGMVHASIGPDRLVRLAARSARLIALERRSEAHLEAYREAIGQLSDPQLKVLQDVCDGKLNKRIANEAGVSLRTVEQRRRRAGDVLGVRSAAPLGFRVGYAAALELVLQAFQRPGE